MNKILIAGFNKFGQNFEFLQLTIKKLFVWIFDTFKSLIEPFIQILKQIAIKQKMKVGSVSSKEDVEGPRVMET